MADLCIDVSFELNANSRVLLYQSDACSPWIGKCDLCARFEGAVATSRSEEWQDIGRFGLEMPSAPEPDQHRVEAAVARYKADDAVSNSLKLARVFETFIMHCKQGINSLVTFTNESARWSLVFNNLNGIFMSRNPDVYRKLLEQRHLTYRNLLTGGYLVDSLEVWRVRLCLIALGLPFRYTIVFVRNAKLMETVCSNLSLDMTNLRSVMRETSSTNVRVLQILYGRHIVCELYNTGEPYVNTNRAGGPGSGPGPGPAIERRGPRTFKKLFDKKFGGTQGQDQFELLTRGEDIPCNLIRRHDGLVHECCFLSHFNNYESMDNWLGVVSDLSLNPVRYKHNLKSNYRYWEAFSMYDCHQNRFLDEYHYRFPLAILPDDCESSVYTRPPPPSPFTREQGLHWFTTHKSILTAEAAAVTIQRWWVELYYRPTFFLKTQQAKRIKLRFEVPAPAPAPAPQKQNVKVETGTPSQTQPTQDRIPSPQKRE